MVKIWTKCWILKFSGAIINKDIDMTLTRVLLSRIWATVPKFENFENKNLEFQNVVHSQDSLYITKVRDMSKIIQCSAMCKITQCPIHKILQNSECDVILDTHFMNFRTQHPVVVIEKISITIPKKNTLNSWKLYNPICTGWGKEWNKSY